MQRIWLSGKKLCVGNGQSRDMYIYIVISMLSTQQTTLFFFFFNIIPQRTMPERTIEEALPRYSFSDDYSEGAHPQVLEAVVNANVKQQVAYGNDEHSDEARRLIRAKLSATEDEVAVHFVPTGTAANLICIASCLRPYEAVVTVDTGHITCKEAGAIEATGHKLIPVSGVQGKLTAANLEKAVRQNQAFPHMAKPRLVYISNATETGTIYTKAELQSIRGVCNDWNLLLHMDGARIGVALSALENDVTPRDLVDLVDIFWMSGTKMGALFGEAVVVRRHIAEGFAFYIKQHGALMAKGRVMGAQFAELFRGDLYFQLSANANSMARRISDHFELLGYPLFATTYTNQVFAILPQRVVDRLQERFSFYIWEQFDDRAVIRIVTSWATSPSAVDDFNAYLQKLS